MLKINGFTQSQFSRIKLLFIFISCLCLTACGFHIRSKADIPPQLKILYISSVDKHSNLIPILRQNFEELGVHIVQTPQRAPYTLAILNEKFYQSKIALGTAQQINTVSMYYTVTYAITRNDHKTLVSPITLTTSTSYLQNTNQILGDMTMLPSYQQTLMRTMANQILSHLSAKNTAHALSD